MNIKFDYKNLINIKRVNIKFVFVICSKFKDIKHKITQTIQSQIKQFKDHQIIMEKQIFRNVKKTNKNLASNSQKQDRILQMTVQQIQDSLINKMNQNSKQSINESYNTKKLSDSDLNNKNKHLIYQAKHQNNHINDHQYNQPAYDVNSHSDSHCRSSSSRSIPELMLQNDQMKNQIQNLKRQKQLIIQKYQHSLTQSRKTNPKSYEKTIKKSQQFSFRKSIDQAERETVVPSFKKKYFTEDLLQEDHANSINSTNNANTPNNINTANNPNSTNNPNYNNLIASNNNQDTVNSSLPGTDAFNINTNSKEQTGQNQTSSLKRKLGKSVQTRYGVEASLQKRQKSSRARLIHPSQSRNSIYNSLEDRFYDYCKNQIVRVNSQNAKLNLKLGELQNKLTATLKQNETLKILSDHMKQQIVNLQNSLSEYKKRLQKISLNFQNVIKDQNQNHQKEVSRFQSDIKNQITQNKQWQQKCSSKDSELLSLKTKLKQMDSKCEKYETVMKQNSYLQLQLKESINRKKRLSEKYLKWSSIDHLWEIKQVQFAGIIELLEKGKTQ